MTVASKGGRIPDDEKPQSSEEMLREVQEWLAGGQETGPTVEPVADADGLASSDPDGTGDGDWSDRALYQAERAAEEHGLEMLERFGTLSDTAEVRVVERSDSELVYEVSGEGWRAVPVGDGSIVHRPLGEEPTKRQARMRKKAGRAAGMLRGLPDPEAWGAAADALGFDVEVGRGGHGIRGRID